MTAARAALLAVLLLEAAAHGHVVEYLHVDANLGGSSGGHAAIRFDDRVYHFRQPETGMLRLARVGFEQFRYAYGVLDNRTIRGARLRVSSDTFALLRDRFNERFLAEESDFAALATLEADRVLLDALLAATAADGSRPAELPSPLPLPGAGLFAADGTGASLATLGRQVRATRGDAYLAARIDAVEAALRSLSPPPSETGAAGFSTRHRELALQREALVVLAAASPLAPGVRVVLAEAPSAAERDRLRVFRDGLHGRILALLDAGRPDWGYPLLVAMARLEAVEETLATGTWVVLDAFADDAETISGPTSDDRRRFLEEQRRDAERAWAGARATFAVAGAPREADYAGLEETSNRLAEVTRGLEHDAPVRVDDETLRPRRGVVGRMLPIPEVPRPALQAARTAVEAAERRHRNALEAAYDYRLLSRNCASEIFATIEAALGKDGSVARLGGYVDPQAIGTLVPWTSFRAVLAAYAVDAVEELPSYRRTRLAHMYETEPRPVAYLREANTLTSTVYRPVGRDGLFVFFTDDVVAPRPLYGIVNLVAGLGEVAVGAVLAPLDGGRSVGAGVRSVAASLPELAFVNVRKGTMAYGRPALAAMTPQTAVRPER